MRLQTAVIAVTALITSTDAVDSGGSTTTATSTTRNDLVAFNKNDLLKFRNFGKKSLTELEELVEGKNLAFGMDVSKYKLESE